MEKTKVPKKKIGAHKAKSGKYKGETTLLDDKYPVTKKGKLSCSRVVAANAYGEMHGHIKKLKQAGLDKYAKKCGFNI